MKLLADFFPILLFFIAYKFSDIYIATAVAIVASVVQVAVSWLRTRHVEKMHLITMALIVVLGGATLLLQDETFIKWKPTVVNWIFALVFLGSQFIGRKPALKHLMASNITLPDVVWSRLNTSWVLFFIALGAINLYVAYYFDTDTWVNFKLFGILGLTLIFVIAQGIYMSRHIAPQESDKKEI